MNSEEKTLPNLESIAQAIDTILERLDRIENRMDRTEEKNDQRFEAIRLQHLSFDVRIDRIEATCDEIASVAKNSRADVKVLREEVHAWIKEVVNLSKLPA